jgi:hypothetical protein
VGIRVSVAAHLRLIDPPYSHLTGKPIPFNLVDAMPRLVHKYDFSAIQANGILHLSNRFSQEEEGLYFSNPAMSNLKGIKVLHCYLDDGHTFHDVLDAAVTLRLNACLPALHFKPLF